MNKNKSEQDNTIIKSDKYLSESGVQGGKIIGEHIVLGSLIFGIPFLIMGLIGLFMVFSFGFPAANTANIILFLLFTVIGLLLIIGAYNIYRTKHIKK
jgi:putative Mn2+ efflux pump MntP